MRVLDGEKLNQVLNDRLEYNIAMGNTAGAELMVLQQGQEIVHITKGWKDYFAGEKLTPGCMYRLASMTKPITGIATLLAVQNGWFNLDDKLKDYLPEFSDLDVAVLKDGKAVVDHKAKSDLRIWQLLCHCNGILAESEVGKILFEEAPRKAFLSNTAMLEYAAGIPLAFDPGTCSAYTGYTSFDAVAKIIEIKSGLKYSEYLKKNIFDPLEITNITYHPTEEQWQNMVHIHDRTESKTFVSVDMGRYTFEGFDLNYECGGAGLAGTLEDYAKIAELLQNNGTLNGVKILEPEMVEEMKKPRVGDDIPGRDLHDSWGLGVRVKVHEDWLPKGIFGWSGAYGTHFWVDQENKISALLFRNMRWHDSNGPGQLGFQFEQDVMSCAE